MKKKAVLPGGPGAEARKVLSEVGAVSCSNCADIQLVGHKQLKDYVLSVEIFGHPAAAFCIPA